MGGAANVLGLADLIMSEKLPIKLRVLVAAADNLVDANAFRPGDIINTRKGLTVEIGNTDAEGRLVLADALTMACEEKPDLLLDFATLTGAARVALGPDLSAIFSDHEDVLEKLLQAGEKIQDHCWRLPLYKPYRSMLNSNIADINNVSTSGFAGATTAGLFLKEFVKPNIPWVHLDIYSWNKSPLPGRPEGGDAAGLRAAFELIKTL